MFVCAAIVVDEEREQVLSLDECGRVIVFSLKNSPASPMYEIDVLAKGRQFNVNGRQANAIPAARNAVSGQEEHRTAFIRSFRVVVFLLAHEEHSNHCSHRTFSSCFALFIQSDLVLSVL